MTVTSHDGGAHWSHPVHVVDLEDGGLESIKFTDYPSNVDGRATQTGFQFRTGSWGNLGLDPVTGKVYVVWTDNSDGAHDVPAVGYPEGQGAGAGQLRDVHLCAAGALSLVVREAL